MASADEMSRGPISFKGFLDSSDLSMTHDISMTASASPEVMLIRAKAEARSQGFRDVQDFVLFVLTVLAVAAFVLLCAWKGLLDPAASPEAQRAAQAGLSAVVSGLLSFVVGRALGRASGGR